MALVAAMAIGGGEKVKARATLWDEFALQDRVTASGLSLASVSGLRIEMALDGAHIREEIVER
jgi:hypothetical protein